MKRSPREARAMGARAASEARRAEIVGLIPVLRRVAEARIHDPDTVDDVVQKAAMRVIEARERLVPSALASYGVVTVRNLIISLERRAELERRHKHRLLDLREPERPDELALREEERRAITTAIARLSVKDRGALIGYEVIGTSTATLASELDRPRAR
jgi:RNA polymerase sigma factor (sigma-70 family)